MPTAVLVNDTSLFNSHFGCQLVGQTIREQCARTGLELIAAFPLDFQPAVARPFLERADLVIINGEGSIHHGRNLQLLEIANQYPAALINCVFEENGPQPLLQKFQFLAARESLSAADIRTNRVDCDVVPDLIFASTLLRTVAFPKPNLDVGFTDNVTNPLSGFSPKSDLVYHSLHKIARCRRLCAGRFHAAIAAAVLRVPFSTWDSNTWKTRGMMQDIGIGHLHFETQSDAIANVPNAVEPKVDAFVDDARSRIAAMFDSLHELANANATSSL